MWRGYLAMPLVTLTIDSSLNLGSICFHPLFQGQALSHAVYFETTNINDFHATGCYCNIIIKGHNT
jgi:hypothetical protein